MNGENSQSAIEPCLVQQIRSAAGLENNEGPSKEIIENAVAAFAEQFAFWFTRVVENAVPKYRPLVVQRINAFVRPIEFEGDGIEKVVDRLVSDYINRNFVTAGGWAIEKMAVALSENVGGAKASARGIDIERTDASGSRHLYVIKSGKVTRNSDILSKLKQHARAAEKLIRQGGSRVGVSAYYVVAAGATASTFDDGIHRPSSGQFWADITGLEEQKALALVREIATAAGRKVTRDTDAHINALLILVRTYLQDPHNPNRVDWPFVFKITMTERRLWMDEDKERHNRALASLEETGYKMKERGSRKTVGQSNGDAQGKKRVRRKKIPF